MTKYTKWIAGGLGWALGGPIGGILGFVFGSMLDGMSGTDVSVTTPTRAGDFRASLLVLSAAIMKADGRVVKAELDYVKNFFSRNFGEDKAVEDMLILREILKRDIQVSEVCFQIRQYMNYSDRLQLLHYLFGISKADNNPTAAEINWISIISNDLGINLQDFESIRAMFVRDSGSAYKILEISPEASDDEVKKAYRRMAMKYHPDKVTSLGEDVQKAAHEKFQMVNAAYEAIKKERGMV